MTALGTQSDTCTQVQDPQPPQNESALLTAHQNWYNLNYCIQKRTGSCWERGLQIRTRLYPIPEAIHDALTLNRYALGLVVTWGWVSHNGWFGSSCSGATAMFNLHYLPAPKDHALVWGIA